MVRWLSALYQGPYKYRSYDKCLYCLMRQILNTFETIKKHVTIMISDCHVTVLNRLNHNWLSLSFSIIALCLILRQHVFWCRSFLLWRRKSHIIIHDNASIQHIKPPWVSGMMCNISYYMKSLLLWELQITMTTMGARVKVIFSKLSTHCWICFDFFTSNFPFIFPTVYNY